MSAQHYIKVILPLRLEWEPCYITDADLRAGDRVAVIFAGRRVIGVVSDPDATPDIDPSRIRPILSIETGLDSISAEEISLWRFMADYYLCTTGEVYKAAYPVLKTASEETKVRVSRRKAMLENRTIALWQQRIARLKARLDAKDAALSKNHGEAVRGRLEEQRRAIAKELQDAEGRLASFSARMAIAEGDYSSLLQNLPQQPLSPLLLQALASGKPVLFKSAAREEAYLQACAMQLRKNRNACILVNEIELAGRLRDKLEWAFGELLLVHHSHMTRGAQRRIMDDIRSGRPYVLIGTRSSIFLPHHDLGLIIVDNEESPFYKQSDSAPRYNARDCAVQLARIHNCHIILGSCSPSLESALNVRTGKYFLLDLSSQGRELHPGCRYTLVDIRAERRKNGMQGPVSRILAAAMARSGKCALIRGYEKPEELEGLQADIFTIPQAAKTDLAAYDLVAMLNADALFDAGNFRSDEHAFQYLERLRCICPAVIVQSAQAAHQVFSMNSSEGLMEERRVFGLPPYSRLIDLRVRDAEAAASLSEALAVSGFRVMQMPETVRVILPRDKHFTDNKKKLRKIVETFRRDSKSDVIADVDPL